MVMVADFRAAHAAEKALGVVAVDAVAETVRLLMVDPVHREAGMEIVPRAAFVGINLGALGDPGANEVERRDFGGEHAGERLYYSQLAALAHLYDPAAEVKGAITLAEFLASRFDGRPSIGDRTRFGAVELIVRDMQGDTITQVGVELDPAPKHPWRSWLRLLYWRPG